MPRSGRRTIKPTLSSARGLIQVYQPWFAKLGITYTQYLVLMVLWEQDALPLNAISRRLYLP